MFLDDHKEVYLVERYVKPFRMNVEKEVCDAFSHFSWAYSKQTHQKDVVIMGFKPIGKEKGKICFSRPIIVGLDENTDPIKKWFSTHKCNTFCEKLDLEKHPSQSGSKNDEGKRSRDSSLSPLSRKTNRVINHVHEGLKFFEKQAKANNQLYQHFMLTQRMKAKGLTPESNFSQAIIKSLDAELISNQEADLLKQINREGNQAKHDMNINLF